ncbi:hypothetical protein CMK14_03330 [Candidatus Poribacteria bacterium]|nr:hypothetical protein [Candidatus Poribacteria bacterium]
MNLGLLFHGNQRQPHLFEVRPHEFGRRSGRYADWVASRRPLPCFSAVGQFSSDDAFQQGQDAPNDSTRISLLAG